MIVDTAPTGHTLRLLAAPALLGRVAGFSTICSPTTALLSAPCAGTTAKTRPTPMIAELEREGAGLAAILRDRKASEMSWVTLPDPWPSKRLPTRSQRWMPRDSGPPTHRESRHSAARRRLRLVRRAPAVRGARAGTGGTAVRRAGLSRLPERPGEPRGVKVLAGAGKLIQPWRPPASAPPVARRVRVTLDLPPRGGSHGKGQADLPPKGGSSNGGPVASAVGRKNPFGSARWLLFGGKGGVGKTTCAAAAALDLAADQRVLLVSTDPAHSLGDVFGAAFGDDPRRVPGGPATLHVREIDAAVEMARFRRKYVAAVDEAFARIARSAGGDQAAFRELIRSGASRASTN